MRRSRGALLPPVPDQRVRGRSLYRTLRDALLAGALAPGERLPSSRQAAADYRVSRGMVEQVYGQLGEEGFLERGIGRGTFVAAPAARPGVAGMAPAAERRLAPGRRGRRLAASAACREPERPRAFDAGVADTREFPWRTWLRLQSRACRTLAGEAMNLADPRGVPALRTAIARHLAGARGIRCQPGQVVVFSSSQQALLAATLLLLERGDGVWLEDPCYPGARAALELAGAAIAPIPVDAHGLRVEVGLRVAPRARLAYVTPSHQYPTGAMLSLERRRALLAWANRRGAWIVEDDYDGEFRYAGQPLTPLVALDPDARVIYLGTFSKATFVSLRLAYLVLPEPLVEPLANLRTQLDGFTPAIPQLTMSAFMDDGHFAPHLRRMRAIYGEKHAQLVAGLRPLAQRGWSWSPNPAGLHLLVRHPSAELVRRVVATSGLALARLSAYRLRPARDDGLLLRYGGLDLEDVCAGAAQLAHAVARATDP
ncbi:MAG TPA: PLP-dependent aminotransferase family protein [Gemmatimonadales bacterium]|nr:PLP-dependent aminotransferase family protein [Gemmatimonadales bacterium]